MEVAESDYNRPICGDLFYISVTETLVIVSIEVRFLEKHDDFSTFFVTKF